MAESRLPGDFSALNSEARAIWNGNAAWWDERVGPEGNNDQRFLIGPATERLLNVQQGEVILDIACGSGIFSRRMVALGARVVAFDFSETFVEIARARTTVHTDRIEYRVLDATDPNALQGLGARRFDAAVCTMALMDTATIEPLSAALGRLLKPGGRFVFSVTHPCFNSTGTRRMVEEELRDGNLVPVFSVKVTEYLQPSARKGVGIIGQPAPQYYFDRPLHLLLNTFFRVGFVLDGLEEPQDLPPELGQRGFSWRNWREIPPHLIARMRLV